MRSVTTKRGTTQVNGYVRDGASDEAPTDQPRCEGFWQVSHQRVKAAGGMPGQQGLTVGIGAMQFRLGLRAHTGTGRYQWWELWRRLLHNNGRGRRFHAVRRGVLRGRQVHNGQREHVDMGSRHWQRWLLSGGSIPSQAQAMARSQPREVPSLSSESGEWKKSRKLGQSTIQWRMVIATKISGGQYITPKNILKSGTAARHPLNA
jgi:hypothetical protein